MNKKTGNIVIIAIHGIRVTGRELKNNRNTISVCTTPITSKELEHIPSPGGSIIA